jgi:hypothetical protein
VTVIDAPYRDQPDQLADRRERIATAIAAALMSNPAMVGEDWEDHEIVSWSIHVTDLLIAGLAESA